MWFLKVKVLLLFQSDANFLNVVYRDFSIHIERERANMCIASIRPFYMSLTSDKGQKLEHFE